MSNKFLIFLILIFLLTSSISAQDIDAENPILFWEESANANGYKIQIRNESEEIITDKDVSKNSFRVDLEPGTYSHRVGVYNKFGKISSYSEWSSFTITRSLPPEVTSEKSIVAYKKELEKKILIEGNNLSKETNVILKNEQNSVTISKVKSKKSGLELTINNELTQEGIYDLTLENPRKKSLTIKEYYTLKPNPFFAINENKPEEKSEPKEITEKSETNETKDTTEKPLKKPEEKISEETLNYPYWGEALRSTILPGWGQVRKAQTYSAIFFDIGIILSAGYLHSTYSNFRTAKENYNNTVNNSIFYQVLVGEQIGTYYMYSQNESEFQKANKASNSVYQASILLASFYTLNILDALLWKISAKPSDKTSFRFFTNIQVQPMANSNYPTNPSNNSTQIEIGLQFRF